MAPGMLKSARRNLGLTQKEAANRLGVSQPYLSLLEKGKRGVPAKLAQKAVRAFKMSPTALPAADKMLNAPVDAQKLARQLSALGYPGFAYMRSGWTRNPAEVLLRALAQHQLEARVAEALPWLLLQYSDMDREWLVREARLHNLSNRLGFFVALARRAAERSGRNNSAQYHELGLLEAALRKSRLADDDTFGEGSVSQSQREWLKQNRLPEAEYWNLLTDWKPEHLQYV
jgi:transcriptional regulator with XRE-family HTH domain